MVELRELDTARVLLRQTTALSALKVDDPERYQRLEHLLSRPYFEPRDAWPEGAAGKDRRRDVIAGALASELAVAPPSRLLSLVGQALKWQQHTGALPPGAAFDLFRAAPPARRDELETYPTSACAYRVDLPVLQRLRAAVSHWLPFPLACPSCTHAAARSGGEGYPFREEVACRGGALHTRWTGAPRSLPRAVPAIFHTLSCCALLPSVSHHWLVRWFYRGVGRLDRQIAHRPGIPSGRGVHDAQQCCVGAGRVAG